MKSKTSTKSSESYSIVLQNQPIDHTIPSSHVATNKNNTLGDKTMTDVQTIASTLIEAGEVVGFRFVDHEVAVGDELQNSYVWDGDEKTEDELPGTCAFESWTSFVKYAQYSRGAGKCVVITGRDKGRGTDFAGEIYVAEAVVVAVMEW